MSKHPSTTYATKTKGEPNVFAFKLKFLDRTTYLSQHDLGKVASWAREAGEVTGIFQRGDMVEVQFSPEALRTKIESLEECQVNDQVKVVGSKSKIILLRLQQVPMEVSDEEIGNYISRFGQMKGTIRRQRYSKGPLKGLENGSRTVMITSKEEICLPSYHQMREKRFEITHRGMAKTCFWCLKVGDECLRPVKGNCRICKTSGTP